MNPELKEAIKKAIDLLAHNRHAAIATVNEDGLPHNTPFYFLYEPDFSLVYWGSHPESIHSQNIRRTHVAFLVLYDSVNPKKGGLYLLLEDCHELAGEELKRALLIHNQFRSKENKELLPLDYYESPCPQRMYSGKTSKCWVLMSQDDKNGLRVKDYRQEVNLADLI